MRAVRSPLAPKITMEQGVTGLRSSPSLQAASSVGKLWFTRQTINQSGSNFNTDQRKSQTATPNETEIRALSRIPVRSNIWIDYERMKYGLCWRIAAEKNVQTVCVR